MLASILPVLIFLLIFGLLVLLTHFYYKSFRPSSEVSRKLLHVTGGILALFLPTFFSSHWPVLLLCSVAFLVLLVTYVKKLLPSVHEVPRFTLGSIFFPIPVYVCFYFSQALQNELLFYLPIITLTLSDTVAEWLGKKWGRYTTSFFKGQKTLAGTAGFATCTLVLSLVYMFWYYPNSFIKDIIVSIILTIVISLVELISIKGFDNLTIPLVSMLLLICLL